MVWARPRPRPVPLVAMKARSVSSQWGRENQVAHNAVCAAMELFTMENGLLRFSRVQGASRAQPFVDDARQARRKTTTLDAGQGSVAFTLRIFNPRVIGTGGD